MAILTANQLSKVYGHKQNIELLNNISFSVEKGICSCHGSFWIR